MMLCGDVLQPRKVEGTRIPPSRRSVGSLPKKLGRRPLHAVERPLFRSLYPRGTSRLRSYLLIIFVGIHFGGIMAVERSQT